MRFPQNPLEPGGSPLARAAMWAYLGVVMASIAVLWVLLFTLPTWVSYLTPFVLFAPLVLALPRIQRRLGVTLRSWGRD